MYSLTVASGLDFGGGGLGLTLNPIGQARERRSSIYGSTEKVFAGLLGAAPASGSPSLVFWVWLVARWYGESSCRSVPSTAWPVATPWAVGHSLLGCSPPPLTWCLGFLPPGCRDRRASGPFLWAEPLHRVSAGGFLPSVWPRSVPRPVQLFLGGTVVLRQPGGWPPRFDRHWLPGCSSVAVLGARSVVWGLFAGPQRISKQVSARSRPPPALAALCGEPCRRYRDPWEDAAVLAGRERTTRRARAAARAVALVLYQSGARAGASERARGARFRRRPWPC